MVEKKQFLKISHDAGRDKVKMGVWIMKFAGVIRKWIDADLVTAKRQQF